MGRSHIRNRKGADPAGYGFAFDQLPRPLDPHALFHPAPDANDPPLEVEIGSGKGAFLINEGRARPEVRLLGVERARRYWLYAADRLRRNARTNARLLLADATEALTAFPAASVGVLHVYFPDPWPKRRHAHRRLLLQPAFLTAAERCLASGGTIRIVTDNLPYFEAAASILETRKALRRCPYVPPLSARPGELVGSNFERKYRLEGREIRAAAFRRRSADEDNVLAREQDRRKAE